MADVNASKKGVIVLISNDADTQSSTELEKAGFEVILCKESPKALNLAENKPTNWKPTLFIVDVILPQISGYELARRLVSKWGDKNIPIIMMSRHNTPEDLAETLSSGAIALIPKPLTWNALADVIEKERMRRLKHEIGDLVFKIGYE